MHRFNVHRLMRVSWPGALLTLTLIAVQPSSRNATDAQILAYQTPHTRIRLLATGPAAAPSSPRLLAGIEITLESGWKTYWRSPGDGISPSFSWDESANLKAAEVLWPAPVRFAEVEGTSIGYTERVVLPVLITPEDPRRPVSLNLAIAYGVCKDICMPVDAELSLDMDAPAKHNDRADVLAALERVPRKQQPGIQCPHRFVSAKLASADGRPVLRVETAFDAGTDDRDLMVEAPQEAALGAPTLEAQSAEGRSSYLFQVEAESLSLLKDRPLTFTAVSDQGSCESSSPVE
jgi:DsbC/DsbD-like thiol-disulfide interchange protein